MPSQPITIVNKLGLHARATTKLVTLANEFDAEVLLRKGEREVNAKSIMGVLMLAASKGTELELVAEGLDAPMALERISKLIAERFGEAE